MASKALSNDFKKKLIINKTEYDSINQAISLAKLHGADDKLIQPLHVIRQQLYDSLTTSSNRVLKSMQLSTNVLLIVDCWYGIRYSNDNGDLSLRIEILNAKDLPILQRDGRKERELTTNDVNTLIPACLDEVDIGLYKQTISVRAKEYMSEHLGLQIDEEKGVDKPLTVSSHAGKRYIQRVLGIGINNESIAEDYRREHLKEIEDAIFKGYAGAERMWLDDEGIMYSMDEDNWMYVVGNSNIITMYEEDFGFTKDINRMIAFQQREVLVKANLELANAEQDYRQLSNVTEIEVLEVEDNISVLKAQLDLLLSRKVELGAEKERHNREINLAKSKFTKEFNKLFKKWNN